MYECNNESKYSFLFERLGTIGNKFDLQCIDLFIIFILLVNLKNKKKT